MQYLLLIYKDEKRWDELPEAARDQMWRECDDYCGEMKASGHFVSGAPLHPSTTATTLRLANGQPVITDGPFAETKEVLAGYCLVECKDLDEALVIGRRFPGLKVGLSLELRPVLVR